MKKNTKTTAVKNNQFINDMKVLMQKAWQFVRELGKTMAEGMKMAWAWFKLRAKMMTSIVEFSYKKVDGSVRIAKGTLMKEYLPAPTLKADGTPKKAGRPVKVGNMRYFDMDANNWRSFVIENLVQVA